MRPRQILHVIGPSIAYVPLTQGQFATIDIDDAGLLGQNNWFAQWCRSTKSFYAGRGAGGSYIAMHRVVAGTPEGLLADHINHHTLHNWRGNLRNVDGFQNQQNRKLGGTTHKQPHNYGKGWIQKKGNSFTACYRKDLKRHRRGGFATEDAARDFLKARLEV